MIWTPMVSCKQQQKCGVARQDAAELQGWLEQLYICDAFAPGGGWTVIQRRVDGSVSFDRTWRDYKEGFGDLHSEFWLGNENIHELSSQGEYSLLIQLEDWSNKHKHALYQSFRSLSLPSHIHLKLFSKV